MISRSCLALLIAEELATNIETCSSSIDYIPLDVVIEVLTRHSKFAEEKFMKKSTTAFEGLLIEGDEVYRGLPRQLEIVREFKSQRPRSLFSGSDKGET